MEKVKVVKDKCEEVKQLIQKDTEVAAEVTSRLKTIEYEIENADSANSNSIALAACRIEEEEQRGRKLRETLENLQAQIDASNKRERQLYDQSIEGEVIISKCKTDIQDIKHETAEIAAQVALLEPRVNMGISVTEAAKLMCNICQKRMEFSMMNPEMASIIEETSFNTSRSSDPIVGLPIKRQ
jgi:chromosome segregation ATPase